MKKNKIINKGCFIIAEAGVNHNGDLGLAKKMIDAAKNAKADAVKFQTFKAEELVTSEAPLASYQQRNIGGDGSQMDMLKKMELANNDFIKLKKYCDKKGIIFLSTPHTESAADFLADLMPAFKIASPDLTNLPLLEKIASKQKWIILSTGMSSLKEIEQALKTIREISKKKISLLHCTTDYPCPLDEVNLNAMSLLKEKFEKKFAPLEIGYSDHTEGIIVSVGAAALGAKVIERHFTLDKNLPGPDHKASLNPEELQGMVKVVRDIEVALGNGIKKPTKNEEKIKKIIRKSIVVITNIKRGEIIRRDMLLMKRPGTGIKPEYLGRVVGRKAKQDIKKDKLLSWNMI